jgi:outer membrane lipoprotein-sorting protein
MISLFVLALLLSGISGCGGAQKSSADDKKTAEPPPASTSVSTPPAQDPEQTPAPPPVAGPSKTETAAHALPEFKAKLDDKSLEIMTAAARIYGGLEHTLQIRDMTMKAKTTGPSPLGGQLTLEMTFYLKAPNKMRTVTSGLKEGQKIIVAFDGTSGWTQLLMGETVVGIQDLPKEQFKQLGVQLTQNLARMNNPFFEALKQENCSFKFLETVSLETGPADSIELTLPDGKTTKIFVDQRSHDLVKLEQPSASETVETLFSDYRMVEGRRTAFLIKTVVNQKPMAEMQIEEIKVNSGVDEALFVKPGSK